MSAAENKAVFLSYASQDAEAAQRLCEALRAAGVEVWFDQSELVGGDQWDGKIRGQISSCALFIPIISANTQARLEGYFRIEWKLAARRTHAMAASKAFLFPVVIDATRDTEAHVPDEFREVQWTKLPCGETTSSFCERVNRLLSGNAGRDRLIPPQGATAGSGEPALQKKHPPWLVPAIVGTVAIAAVAAWLARQPAPSALSAETESAANAPLTEARQLLERARVIVRADGALPRDNLEAVEKLLAKAVVLDPTDAECWALAGWIDARMVMANYDGTNERRLEAQRKAAKALALAPSLPWARRAHAYVLAVVLGPSMLDEVVKIYRTLIAEAPGDRSLKIEFGTILGKSGRIDEAAVLFEQTGNRPSAAWNYFIAGRFSEARRLADQLLAEKRTASFLLLKGHVEWLGFEDLDAAQAVVDQFTPAELLLDDPVVFATAVAVHRRDPERVVRLMSNFPREFMTTSGFFYPKRFWAGQAHQMAGRTEAAEAEWELALRLVDERLKATPNEPQLLLAKADLLISLGQREEAGRLFQLLTGLGSFAAMNSGDFYRIMLLTRLGRAEEALAAIAAAAAEKHQDSSWPILHANLRFQPFFDGLRKDPRFEKLLRDNLPQGAKPFDDPKPVAPATKPDEKSVAVLAFANLSDDKANEYFSDGISEELISALGRVPGLTVKGSTSAFYFKHKEDQFTSAEIARQLGVTYLVRGSVRKAGDKVRITAQLTRAATDDLVWSSEPLDRKLEDAIAVQEEIAALIAQNLKLKLDVGSRTARKVNPEAHRLVLEGRHFWNQRSEPSLARAETAFRQAIVLAPGFAEAHAGLADVYQVRMTNFTNSGDDAPALAELKKAQRAAERARELDPSLAEPYATLGYVTLYSGSFSDAAALLERAIALNPNLALAHRYSAPVLGVQGRLDLGVEAARRAMEIDPLSVVNCTVYARFLGLARRYPEALEISARALRLEVDDLAITHWTRPVALWALGRREEAIEEARLVLRSGAPGAGGAEALWVLHAAGLGNEVTKIRENLESKLAPENYLRGFNLVAVGRAEEAWPFLQRTPRSNMLNLLFYSPVFDTVRDDPQFQQLLAKLGCAEEYKVGRQTLARMTKQAAPSP